jgi:uncharacterized protein
MNSHQTPPGKILFWGALRTKNNLLRLTLAGAALIAANAATAGAITPAIPEIAHPLPLDAVRLTRGPLKNAQQLDAKYLLELEPDRMLYYLRLRAGLQPKATQGYGGWDGAGRQLTGHIAGHYLSAVSYMYAATGDPRFKERADYIVNELKEIQDKQGDGYIGALLGNAPRGGGRADAGGTNAVNSGTNAAAVAGGGRRRGGDANLIDGKTLFNQLTEGVIRSGGFDLNGMWSPWYVEHKIFAGLRDAYRFTGNRTALDVETKFAGWTYGIVSKLTEAQDQRMLETEFGGMNEVLADLYADTGDERWLKASDCFEHLAIVKPLSEGRDILGGKHGNTQVPKMLGELARYIDTGNETDGKAAKFFWDQVVFHHSFATGGHGYDEYFGAPDKLSGQVDATGQRSKDFRTCESCNVYNMIKMSRSLFAIEPDIKYADFHERALFNHVLGSIDPTAGWTCYMVPVGPGVTREYERNMTDGSFTCCVGSGMESHALHGYGLYYESGDKLWVNIYAPSIAQWKGAGAELVMDTTFPEGDAATLKLNLKSPKQFTLALRRPFWAGDGFSVKVNGQVIEDLGKADSYVEIKRTWKTGDTVALALPKTLREEPLADNPHRVALMYGPLVLAGDLGTGGGRGRSGRVFDDVKETNAPVFLVGSQPVEKWLKPVAGKPDCFRTEGAAPGREVDFVPFYQLHRRTYGAYWDLFTPEEWAQKSAAYTASLDKQARLTAATVDYVQPGEMQPETDHNFQGEETTPVRVAEQAGRRGSKAFSFDVKVEPEHPMALVVTYRTDEAQKRSFDILVDGHQVKQETLDKSDPARFMDVEYPIPADLVRGKQKVTVRFQAGEGSEIAAVFGLRVVRADAER